MDTNNFGSDSQVNVMISKFVLHPISTLNQCNPGKDAIR